MRIMQVSVIYREERFIISKEFVYGFFLNELKNELKKDKSTYMNVSYICIAIQVQNRYC